MSNADEGDSVNDLIDTTEMYLRTIYELEEEGVVPLRARIAERLQQSGPTVSQTVARMERDGLVVVADDRHLQLTDHGRELAIAVMRDHPTTSPYGNPIPGLDKLGDGDPAPPAEADLVRLDEFARTGGGRVEIRRIAEHVQLDESLMTELKSVGIVPGGTVTIGRANGGTVEVTGGDTTAQVASSALHAVLALAR
jgi:DtxR family Mn-dependent transcriptional regulator